MTIVAQSPTAPASLRPTLTLPAPPLTVADLDEIGLDDPRLELVDGMWVVRPWPTPLRTRVTQRLSRLLALAAPDRDVVAHRVSVQINDRTELSPDIVITQLPAPPAPTTNAPTTNAPTTEAPLPAPAPALADDVPTRRVVACPRLVIEVAEPANRRFDRTVKLDLYRERGIPACWLVAPDPPSIEAWELRDGAYTLAGRADGDQELTVTTPFPVTIVPADLVVPPEANPDLDHDGL